MIKDEDSNQVAVLFQAVDKLKKLGRVQGVCSSGTRRRILLST